MSLTGRVIIVTGAARGIGAAISEAFADAACHVVLADLSSTALEEAAARLGDRQGTVSTSTVDVTVPEDVSTLIEDTRQRYGRLDVLVNNAGVGAVGPSESLALDVWRRAIDVNLTGVFLCSQAAGRVMLEQRSGVIVNLASIFGVVGIPQRAAYASSKHGVLGLTKVLGAEWADRGVRVVAVNPGYVRTDLDVTDRTAGGYTDADIVRRTPAGRFASTKEIGDVVVWLASDAATYITGTSIDVDGGWIADGGW